VSLEDCGPSLCRGAPLWTDLETVETPDLPAAKAALEAAQKPYRDALERWKGAQDARAAQHVPRAPASWSEYRVKFSKCGTRATVQRRDV